jgi:hypothetical protein
MTGRCLKVKSKKHKTSMGVWKYGSMGEEYKSIRV